MAKIKIKLLKSKYKFFTVSGRSRILCYIFAFSNIIFIPFDKTYFIHLLWEVSPFLMFIPGIILAAWYGGFVFGLIATLLSMAVGDFFFIFPEYTFYIANIQDISRLLLFLSVGILISSTIQVLHNARQKTQRLFEELQLIEKKNKKLESESRTFFSTIAHELRTPLSTLQLVNQILLKKYKDKKGFEEDYFDLKNMNEEVESLTILVEDLLDFVRNEKGVIKLKKEPVQLQKYMEEIIKNYNEVLKSDIINLKSAADIVLDIDPYRIKQVLINLFSNAVKASPQDSKIFVSVERRQKNALFSVRDKGYGIKDIDKKHIFERYYKASNHEEYADSGFGLGLYVSKKIIERHKGNIWVESVIGKGSTFYFTIPLGQGI